MTCWLWKKKNSKRMGTDRTFGHPDSLLTDSASLSISRLMSLSLSLCLSLCLSIYLSIYLSACLSVSRPLSLYYLLSLYFCLSLSFWCLSLSFWCLSLSFWCLSLSFWRLSLSLLMSVCLVHYPFKNKNLHLCSSGEHFSFSVYEINTPSSLFRQSLKRKQNAK